jgi:hypothetical protein
VLAQILIAIIAWDMLSILKVVCFEFDEWRRKIHADMLPTWAIFLQGDEWALGIDCTGVEV